MPFEQPFCCCCCFVGQEGSPTHTYNKLLKETESGSKTWYSTRGYKKFNLRFPCPNLNTRITLAPCPAWQDCTDDPFPFIVNLSIFSYLTSISFYTFTDKADNECTVGKLELLIKRNTELYLNRLHNDLNHSFSYLNFNHRTQTLALPLFSELEPVLLSGRQHVFIPPGILYVCHQANRMGIRAPLPKATA